MALSNITLWREKVLFMANVDSGYGEIEQIN
jgi:hypothetical protein